MPGTKPGRVPKAMQVQLARIFGQRSREARAPTRTSAQWRHTLKAILLELDLYRRANVQSDTLHNLMLDSGLASADSALQQEDFWPGYVEGILRFALVLLGDYPNHRRRKPGRKANDHYRLNLRRSVAYVQNAEQRFRTLWAASQMHLPNVPGPMWQVMELFYQEYSYHVPRRVFLDWYRRHHPEAYAAIF